MTFEVVGNLIFQFLIEIHSGVRIADLHCLLIKSLELLDAVSVFLV